jgi:hypothetical protein
VNVDGGDGDDTINVRFAQYAYVSGGSGDDTINAWASRYAMIDAGSGDDHVRSFSSGHIDLGSGDDKIDSLWGGYVNGGSGDDLVYISRAATVDGGSGDDRLWSVGSKGAVISGGLGDDQVSIDGGTAIFNKGDGNDSIGLGPFSGEKNTIKIHGYSADDVSVVESEGSVYLRFAGSDDSIKLKGAIGTALLKFDDGTTLDLGTKYSSEIQTLHADIQQLPAGLRFA